MAENMYGVVNGDEKLRDIELIIRRFEASGLSIIELNIGVHLEINEKHYANVTVFEFDAVKPTSKVILEAVDQQKDEEALIEKHRGRLTRVASGLGHVEGHIKWLVAFRKN